MNYTLTIPECAIEDIYGNCFSATQITVHTTADLMNPLINSFDLANKQHVPNDLPMHFTFNENVYLNDVNHIVVVANTHSNIPFVLFLIFCSARLPTCKQCSFIDCVFC